MIKYLLLFLLIPTLSFADTVNIRPTSDVTTSWNQTGCTAGTHYDCIDETTKDDDSTFIRENVTGGADERFTTGDSGIPSGSTITSVILYGWLRREDAACGFPAGCCTVKPKVIHDSTWAATDNWSGGSTSYVRKSYDVTSKESWQADDFNGDANSIDIAFAYASGTGFCRITMSWIEIQYTPAGIPLEVYTANIYGANLQGDGL